LLKDTNRLLEAEPLMRRALAIDEASLGPDYHKVAIVLDTPAQLLQAIKRSRSSWWERFGRGLRKSVPSSKGSDAG
jgi:hypothetical protein